MQRYHSAQALSGLLLPARGEIWVNAEEARLWPARRRFTIGHELGHYVMHRSGQQALFCRRTSVDEQPATTAADIEQEASAFAAALLMPRWLYVRELPAAEETSRDCARRSRPPPSRPSGGPPPSSALSRRHRAERRGSAAQTAACWSERRSTQPWRTGSTTTSRAPPTAPAGRQGGMMIGCRP